MRQWMSDKILDLLIKLSNCLIVSSIEISNSVYAFYWTFSWLELQQRSEMEAKIQSNDV
jgi:hypothetical protein